MDFNEWKKDYAVKRRAIVADTTLTPLDKENAIRRLANLDPVSESEFEISLKAQEDYYIPEKI